MITSALIKVCDWIQLKCSLSSVFFASLWRYRNGPGCQMVSKSDRPIWSHLIWWKKAPRLIEIDFAVEYPIDYTYRKRERERWRNTWKVTTQWLSVHSSFQSKCTLKCFLDVFLLIWKCFSIRGISFWVLNPLWRYVKKSARMILVLHAFVFFEKSNAWRLEFKNKQIIWVNNLLVIFFFYEFLCHVQWKSMSTY